MRDVLSFHPTGHGAAVRLVAGRRDLIERDQTQPYCGGGLAFSARSVKAGQKVCLQVHRLRYHLPGSLRLGFTNHDPGSLTPSQLPPYLIPDLTDTTGYWATAITQPIAHGSQITVCLDVTQRSATWDLNGLYCGLLVDELDTSQPLWLSVDLYGSVSGLRLVSPGLLHHIARIVLLRSYCFDEWGFGIGFVVVLQ